MRENRYRWFVAGALVTEAAGDRGADRDRNHLADLPQE
jgi:hypothetical protein